MKRTGIARKIDGLGRIVLPVEIRDSLRLRENDKLEIMALISSFVTHRTACTSSVCSVSAASGTSQSARK